MFNNALKYVSFYDKTIFNSMKKKSSNCNTDHIGIKGLQVLRSTTDYNLQEKETEFFHVDTSFSLAFMHFVLLQFSTLQRLDSFIFRTHKVLFHILTITDRLLGVPDLRETVARVFQRNTMLPKAC